MSAPTNHWKLGLFVVVGVCLGLTTFVVLGANSLHKESVTYKFYFDESVQGLDIGSPTKFRGVTVGGVEKIDVAPDRRRVEVTSAMDVSELKRLGLAEVKAFKVTLITPPDLRVQLASQGVTGVKFLLIDFYSPKDYPAPVLPFPVPENYIPTATSTLKNLEDTMTRAADRVPQIMDGLLATMTRVNAMLDALDVKGLTDQALSTLRTTNAVLLSLQKTVNQLDTAGLSKRAQLALDNLNTTVVQLNVITHRLSDEKGLLASAQRTTNALGDLSRNTSGVTSQLEETLRSVQEAAESIERVAGDLERDPDMLLKGRKKTP